MRETDRSRLSAIVQTGALALLALAVRLVHLGSIPPDFDELYHMLAGRSWLAHGALRIADGIYDRAAGFTILAAESMRMFGQSFTAARLPAVLAGTLGVVAVFVWTRNRAGTAAAWVAGLLFALDPGAIHLSQWVRFYTVHGLCVWIGLTTIYAIVEDRPPNRKALALAAGSAAAWALALYLQITTVIPLVAAGLWATWRVGLRHRLAVGAHLRAWWKADLIGAIVGFLVLVALGADPIADLWRMYTHGPIWSDFTADHPRFYVRWLSTRYVILWALFPVAVLVALARFRAMAGFSLTIFGMGLVLQSFGAAKSERYLYYAMPFLFVIWGLAVAALLSGLRGTADELLRTAPTLRNRPRARAAATWVVLGGLLLFAYRYNDAAAMTVQMLAARGNDRPYSQPDWAAAAPTLRRLSDSADVVVSSALVKTLYYLGDGHVGLSRTELFDFEDRPRQFSLDPRTGRPMISEPEALARVMACYRRGLLIIEKDHWRRADVVPGAVADYVTAHAEEVPVTPEWRIKAFRWKQAAPPSSGCPPWRSAR